MEIPAFRRRESPATLCKNPRSKPVPPATADAKNRQERRKTVTRVKEKTLGRRQTLPVFRDTDTTADGKSGKTCGFPKHGYENRRKHGEGGKAQKKRHQSGAAAGSVKRNADRTKRKNGASVRSERKNALFGRAETGASPSGRKTALPGRAETGNTPPGQAKPGENHGEPTRKTGQRAVSRPARPRRQSTPQAESEEPRR